ncbi:sensor domain-containing phosphodiesterase [Sphingobium sp. YR768]|uniref:sensor domain-containing phosphodiesterase n=1 Tax=Sphingobium sp. YR768 TaxID=1884365 RepID=UPI0008BECCBA|nr:EAL domain-containing protein [Sphingobium sp. YR768]SES10741.1 PAS domain S-box-containing protein/diguanylate cyclase (GGDEF) domain-containing protein [Sphingobium sp. YR768]
MLAMDFSNTFANTSNEAERLTTLRKLDILDTPPERDFDEITRLAATALGVASAAVSLIDDQRQWFKSRHGIPFAETPRDVAFCTHTIASREILIVTDAAHDDRFSGNPLVTQEDGIRFYAGVPLIVSSGYCVGTLCVFDPVARAGLTNEQRAMLLDLAMLATDLIESRQHRRMGEIAARVVEATSDAVVAADQSGAIVYWNPAAARMFGREHEEAIGRNFEFIIPDRLAAGYRDILARAIADTSTRLVGSSVELVGMRADGGEFPVELSLASWGVAARDTGFAAIIRDTSRRKEIERKGENTKNFLDTVIRNLPAMLFVKDAETRQYLMLNQAGEAAIGKTAQEIIGHTDRELFQSYGESYEQRDSEAVAASSALTFESEFVRENGESVHLRTTRTVIDGPDRPRQFILGVSEDVTATRLAEAQVLKLAHYDALTGLLNRASFTDRFHRLVQDAENFALLTIDLDRFKMVNDQFGHPVGDDVLMQVGDRLRTAVGEDGWIARIGGDEFVVVLTSGQLRERSGTIAAAIIADIARPFATEKCVAHAGASIGIVLAPDDGTTTAQLRENVDLALYRAKQIGKGNACFFNAEMDAAAQDRRMLEKDLWASVVAGDIALAYQPVLAAKTGQITSVEALARWTHAERGPIRPDIFIPLAEECGLIDTLGEQLLRRACHDAQTWPDHVRVAVNLSPLQFLSGKLIQTVRDAIATSRIRADRLQLEVTEGLVIRDVERTFEQLEQLRALGIQVLIDDFGVGYSSLSYFQRFPFDKVKLDKSFVDEIATSRAAKAIVKAVVGLGEELDMGVVAEGVETEEQMQLLVASGCTHLQGYFFSRPVSADAMRTILGVVSDTATSGSAAA